MDVTVMNHGDAANAWFLGANIPGKGPNVFVYFGGVNDYLQALQDAVGMGFRQLKFDTAA